MSKIKTFTAKEVSNNPGVIFRECYKNEKVKINHNNFPDVIFEMIIRPRRQEDE